MKTTLLLPEAPEVEKLTGLPLVLTWALLFLASWAIAIAAVWAGVHLLLWLVAVFGG